MFLDHFDDLENFREELYMRMCAIWENVNCTVHADLGGIFVPPGSLNQLKYS